MLTLVGGRAMVETTQLGKPTPLRTRGLSHRLVFIDAAPRDRRVFVAYYVAARLLPIAWLALGLPKPSSIGID